MKHIKLFGQFLNESTDESVYDFLEALESVLDELRPQGARSYYSLLAYSSGQNRQRDPDADMDRIMEKLAEQGWDEQRIKRLAAENGKELADMQDSGNTGSLTGMGDLFLNRITGGQVVLMGMDTKEQSPDEAVIKFYYGYNKTPYGRLAMEQHFGSIDGFLDAVGEGVGKMLSSPDNVSIETFRDQLSELEDLDLASAYSYDKQSKTVYIDLAKSGADGLMVELGRVQSDLDEFLRGVGLFGEWDGNKFTAKLK